MFDVTSGNDEVGDFVSKEEGHYMMDCRLFFCLATAFIFIFRGHSQTIKLQCPEKFKDNELSLVSCEINSTAFTCGTVIMNFNIKAKGSLSSVVLCSKDPAYPCTQAAPVPTQHGQCACTKLDGNNFTYTLAYRANITRDLGAKIVCQVCPGDPSTVSNCDVLTFEEDKKKEASDVSGNSHDLVVIVSSAIAGTALLMLILYCVRQRSPTASPASPGVEIAPVAAAPDVNQPPAQPTPIETEAESAASSAYEESSVAADEESTVG